ncbi:MULTISPECIES: acyl-CoA dehydrogenase family protein [Acinetobacter]|uniref:Acyl-[acyl-carrier-protein] dehydrogenase MbtN n=2 Tax=Acinetobacter TaxID=469 RepID=A0AB35M268_9GAMM|nr:MULTISPECIES: acyl-CoA dehydrogenase family protein [Acinetobacter]MDM1719854.1 acyl-CoA dehydrogenase family protein [Acinetobacter towneri]MDM1731949.1 acyl-CoA dehydrogenase family protein [Acinetobacter towneri]MDM1734612.1 acyl-CoA dehydrogenase family protein [Acinetobacter towneri]MDM1739930.1 acyl-CoA dehydrogenase family protein [Acinetobacter towneri]MDM1742610.1 acyl-CoA dehydrogenase family protein [Acinetobacter towneri]
MQKDSDFELFRDNYQRFLAEHVAPFYETWEEQGLIPRELWHKLGENGFLCVDVPEEYGGFGAPIHYSQMLVQETAKAGFTALAVGIGGQSELVSPYIQNIGSEEQKQYWLPKMVSGEVVTAIAMTEANAGSDLQAIRTQAILDGDHYVVDGSKTFISNGHHADLIVLVAKTDPQARAKGISILLVDAHLNGVKKGRGLKKIGLHAQDTAELFFDQVYVPKNQLLGQEGHGFSYLMQELPRERLSISLMALGAIQGAIDITKEYVLERKAFGQALSQFQNTRFVLAQAQIKALAAEAFVERCKDLYSKDVLSVTEVAALKCFITDTQCEVIDQLLQLFGGYGYMQEYPISRFFVDARVQKIYGGTNEIMKEIVARELLGK